MRGATTEEMPKRLPMNPVIIGRFCRGTASVMMTMVPEKIPQDPIPAMALPIMNAIEFGAAPQIADPISKMMMAAKKIHLGE
jgi:hypothetical protein